MITSFPNERLLASHGQELLFETDALHRSGKQFVAVARNGQTDYPIVSGYSVLYDHPEWFTLAFRKKVIRALTADYAAIQARLLDENAEWRR